MALIGLLLFGSGLWFVLTENLGLVAIGSLMAYFGLAIILTEAGLS